MAPGELLVSATSAGVAVGVALRLVGVLFRVLSKGGE